MRPSTSLRLMSRVSSFSRGFGLLDRLQIEMRRDHRQMRERPLPALHVVLLGRAQLEQMADRRGEHVVVAFEVVVVTLETAERARDVAGDGRLLGDDQFLCHHAPRVSKNRGIGTSSARCVSPAKESHNDKNKGAARAARSMACKRPMPLTRRSTARVRIDSAHALEAAARAALRRRPSISSWVSSAATSRGAQAAARGERVDVARIVAERSEQRVAARRVCRRSAAPCGGARRAAAVAALRGCRSALSTSFAPCLMSA